MAISSRRDVNGFVSDSTTGTGSPKPGDAAAGQQAVAARACRARACCACTLPLAPAAERRYVGQTRRHSVTDSPMPDCSFSSVSRWLFASGMAYLGSACAAPLASDRTVISVPESGGESRSVARQFDWHRSTQSTCIVDSTMPDGSASSTSSLPAIAGTDMRAPGAESQAPTMTSTVRDAVEVVRNMRACIPKLLSRSSYS